MISPEWVSAIATSAAALSIFYAAARQRRSAPLLYFDFSGSNGHFNWTTRELDISRKGIIRNLSSAQDTISQIGVMVWKPRKRQYDYFALPGSLKVINKEGQTFMPPFNIPARVAVSIEVEVKALKLGEEITGRLKQLRLHPSSGMQLCFETTDKSWFNEKGKLVDIQSAHLLSFKQTNKMDWWRISPLITRQFWRNEWLLTKSMNRHTIRRLTRLIGL